MTLTQLRYVVAVDTHRHFGRAAAHCHVSQPTLSMQIQKLEEELGVPLFDRSRKPVAPTDLGACVIAQARVVLRERDRIRELIAEAAGVVAGELRLGIIPTLAPYLLPLVTARFSASHPAVSLSVREMTTEGILDHLATDRLDAGLLATAEEAASLETRTLFTEPFVAYVAPAHRLAGATVVDPGDLDDVWLLSEGHCFRDQVLHFCESAGRALAAHPIHFESGNLETLRLMVDRLGGLTLLPYLATLYLSERERARVRPLTDPVPQRHVRILYGRAYLKRSLIEAYSAAVVEAVAPVLGPARSPADARPRRPRPYRGGPAMSHR